MNNPAAKVTPVVIPGSGSGNAPSVMPTDAMQQGVYSDLRKGSVHRKKVSGVLHLKKESIGGNKSRTAFRKTAKAFNYAQGN